MQQHTKISNVLYYITTPYKDIYTTVYLIKTDEGCMLFDCASFDCDIENSIKPMLDKLNVTENDLKCVFISHAHLDHAGGLEKFLELYPNVKVITKNTSLAEKFADYSFIIPKEDQIFLGCLKVIFIPGHSSCSQAIYDIRDNTLITGDCLQLYGIYGSGNWACNISLPKLHLEALKKLDGMEIDAIYTAHNYHPLGQFYIGKERVKAAIEYCREPLYGIMKMITENPVLSDEEIANLYNKDGTLPKLGSHVVKNLRTLLL